MRSKGHRPFYCNQYNKEDTRLYCHLTKRCSYNNPSLAQQRRITTIMYSKLYCIIYFSLEVLLQITLRLIS